MKFELDIVRFNVSDIVTASGCADPETPVDFGGDMVEAPCEGVA